MTAFGRKAAIGRSDPAWSSQISLDFEPSNGLNWVESGRQNAGGPVVFEGDHLLTDGGPNYDVSLDGERFLMIKEVQNASVTSQIIIVENWFEELRRLAPTQ